jgi:hypothetical protein
MRVKKITCAVIAATALSGCAGLQNYMYQGYSADSLTKNAGKTYSDLTTSLQKPSEGNLPLLEKDCFEATVADADVKKCTTQRNQAVSALVIASSELCMAHRRSIYGNEAAWNLTFGTMTNLFAGAASVVTVEKTKSILAALALFSNSERSLINETVYKQMLVTAVDKKINEMRDTRSTTIYTSLKLDVKQYTVPEALRDVINLHYSCSFMEGLQKALDEGTAGGTTQKILRLKATLLSLNNELAIAQMQSAEIQKQKASYITGLGDRIKAVNAALATEEAK